MSSTTTTTTMHLSNGAGGAGSEMQTVIQIRNAAAAEVTRSVKGVSPVTMMNSLKRCEDEAKAKEDNSDLTGAYFKLIQAGMLLQHVKESREYKTEAQKASHGALYRVVQDYLLGGGFESYMHRVESVKQRLLEREARMAANSEAGHGTSGEGHARRNSGSGNIAQRLKSLQDAGLAGDLRAAKRPPQLSTLPLRPPTPIRPGTPVRPGTPIRPQTPSARPQTPSARPQTPNVVNVGRPQTPVRSQTPTWPSSPGIPVSTSPRVQRSNPMLSSSLGKPSSPLAADGTWPVMRPTPASPPVSSSPHQLVPISAFGPPSPSGSEQSLSDNAPRSTIHHNLASLHVQSPSEFATAYPTIEELEQMDPDEVLFPSVPRHDPGQKPTLHTSGRETPTAKRQLNGVAIKPLHSSLYNHEQRPASTPPIPINSARRNGFSHSPPSPRHTRYPSGSPLNPAYNSPKNNSNTSSGSPDGPSSVDIPITNSITPRRLFELLESRLNILLLDVRIREQFEQERINHDAIVCLEPSVLQRENINSFQIEASQVISPGNEQALFKNRSKFDLIVIYDDQCTSFGGADSPMSALFRAIFENEFHRPLKRPPMLLVGGLAAWKKEVDDENVLRRLPSTPTVGSFVGSGSFSANNTGPSSVRSSGTDGPIARSSSPSVSSIRSVEERYPPLDKITPQGTGGSETATDGPSRLVRKRALSRAQLASLQSGVTGASRAGAGLYEVPQQQPPVPVPQPSFTRTGSIQYPSPLATKPPPAPEPPKPTPMDPSATTITPPQAASVNPFPISRRRSEYAEQGQHAYSGSISLAKPIDYPQLSAQHVLPPPPRAATPSNTRSPVKQTPSFPSLQQAFQLPNQNLRMIRSDYPINYWKDEQIGISGLRNLGNTCYMNSTLQCLSAAVPFTRFFTDGRWRQAVNIWNLLGSKGKVTEAYTALLADMWKGDALSPNMFRKNICLYAPQFQGTNQHDAQEFLSTLLDGLHEDLNRIIDKPTIETRPEREVELEALPIQIASEQEWKIYRMRNNSLVVDYFQGQFRNRMQCMTCNKTSTTYNAFMYLTLPTPASRSTSKVTLTQCLDAFVRAEVMEKSDAWNCPHCKTLRKATKQLILSRLPPILLIHLKRFSIKGPFTDKIETLVDFPVKGLDLTNYMPTPLPPGSGHPLYNKPSPDAQVPPYRYDLFGVTNHYGTLSSGHYTAFVASSGGWRYCDDSRVITADKSEVVTRAAYILFYKRIPA